MINSHLVSIWLLFDIKIEKNGKAILAISDAYEKKGKFGSNMTYAITNKNVNALLY